MKNIDAGFAKYSRAVERASEAVRIAEGALGDTLKDSYPLGSPVRVQHWRGSYTGAVVGWDVYGCRVAVQNNATGKIKKWWSRHVEIRND